MKDLPEIPHLATGSERTAPLREYLFSRTSLRLRHVAMSGDNRQRGQSSVLWALAYRDTIWSRHVRVTHLIRKAVPLETDIRVVTNRCTGGTPAMSDIPRLRRQDLQLLAGIAAAAVQPVRPDLALLAAPGVPVPLPGLCTGMLAQPKVSIRAVKAVAPVRGVILPLYDPLRFDIDQGIAMLANAGLNADISFDISIRSIDAADIRAIAEAENDLEAVLACPGAHERLIPAILDRIGIWKAAASLRQLHIGLHCDRTLSPDIIRTFSGLMFGVETASSPALPDFSGCMLSGGLPPHLFPTGALARSVGVSPHRRDCSRDPAATRLGHDEAGRSASIGQADLRQHLYISGGTGTGKTTLLRCLIEQDIRAGRGVFVIDPHGDLFRDLCDAASRNTRDRFVLADAGDIENPFTLNILQTAGPHQAVQRNFIANQLIQLFKAVYSGIPEAFGPVFENWFRAALFLLMEGGGPDATLADLERLFGDVSYRRNLLANCCDLHVLSFWNHIAERAGGDLSIENVAPYITAKVTQISGNPLVRPILCTPRTTLDIPLALERGQVVLVNLAKGIVGGPDAAMLGGVLTIRLFAAALARAGLDYSGRHPVRVVLDEFPTFAGPVLAEMLAEARKFGLSLVLANQSLDQIDRRGVDLAHAIQANCGNVAAFRAGPADAGRMASWLGGEADPGDLQSLPNFRFSARLLADGMPLPPRLITAERTAP